jgi:hypothetical protein
MLFSAAAELAKSAFASSLLVFCRRAQTSSPPETPGFLEEHLGRAKPSMVAAADRS